MHYLEPSDHVSGPNIRQRQRMLRLIDHYNDKSLHNRAGAVDRKLAMFLIQLHARYHQRRCLESINPQTAYENHQSHIPNPLRFPEHPPPTNTTSECQQSSSGLVFSAVM
jgi:hypothetical protein